MKTILFVCTGNTCRSSMAEALFRNLLEKEGMDNKYTVKSAGTSVFMSRPASGNAIRALEELGLDLSCHTSKMVTQEMIDEADLILTMTASHKDFLLGARPDAAEKTFTLNEYINNGSKVFRDIGDPFGGDLDIYVSCRNEITESLKKLIHKLKAQD